MKRIFLMMFIAGSLASCKQGDSSGSAAAGNKDLAKVFEDYYQDGLKLDPITATFNGDNRYNDLLPNYGSEAYLKEDKEYYTKYLDKVKQFKREDLNEADQLSYDIFTYEAQMALDGFKFHTEYMPFNQFNALPITIGQFGSGSGTQPFKNVKDYDNWLKRLNAFAVWADTAIVNFNKGIKTGMVLPKSLVVKMIPQMDAMVVTDPTKSLFYGPITRLPKEFSDADKKRLADDYKKAITTVVVPTYKKLGDYLKGTYLAKGRSTSGLSSLPDGNALYAYYVKLQTTTDKTPEQIYQTGLSEVARIRKAMDSIKNVVGFKGDLPAFFAYMKNDPKFFPFKTPKQVLDAFENIHQRMQPNLKKEFTHVPKCPFEIRQTEAFRAASASAEYYQGTPDGSRPGIFYVPILDATKFNITSGMESLFLHEAIPGHHYQISLTQENTSLPDFRRFDGNENAYVEGWALYCESLGKELGLFTDPYQHMGALGDEIHRAIRLVVDVAIHTKGMTREQAIKYMMDNEQIDEQGATAEIERYMAYPAQALSYKTGALKIRELRTRYEKKQGSKFDIAEFHNQVLKDGAMPLSVFEAKMDAWAAKQ
ncbi:hypothetical protein BEL04_22995 [Mucilaginibacter sp. PPCGB 2223]|uniref:DUF885 domain-containing protein n=1 Tax=Mucilaginibacter sp. PPCGB 2223 TaxID=1886027 RepID=UPI00082546B6|nr:DUF885 domain-containing protein [Mucilaginibacter sp. PPCGB 2223]OCX50641.1 hypothetical protein BEL04_22995 [Mucilaginibacter sp. PPCGB 2223]